jgi:hypothetical protein
MAPNQLEDFYQHLELMEKAEAAAKRGHDLFAKGDTLGAQAALDEADELLERAELIEERWKR